MVSTIGKRLKIAREKRGLDQKEIAKLSKGEINQQDLSALERGERKKTGIDKLLKIAEILRVDPSWLMGKIGSNNVMMESHNQRLQLNQNLITVEGIWVVRHVQAGAWEEASIWDESRRYMFAAPLHDDFPLERRFGLEVKGDSMDKFYQEGAVLDCIPLEYLNDKITTGDHVIVERERKGEYEATVKEIEFMPDGRAILHPKSNNPDYGSFVINDVNHPNLIDSTVIRVTALVIGAYQKRPKHPKR